MRHWSRYIRLSPTGAFIWLCVATLITLFFLSLKIPSDPDLFWHIRAGQDILKNGIPHVDWYTFTAPDFPWVNHEFAQDVVIAWLHNLGGLRLVALFFSVVITLTLTLTLRWSRPKPLPWNWALLSGLAIVFLSSSFLGARPQMFSYLLVLVLLGLLYKSRTKPKLLWLIPLLLLVWANWHASFALGMVVVFAFLGAELLTSLVPGRVLGERSSTKYIVLLTLAAFTALGATFINPYLHGIWVETLRTLTDGELHKNIIEWFPATLQTNNGKVFFGITVLAVFALLYKKQRVDLATASLFLVFLLAGASGVRNIPLFLLIAVPLITETIYEWWPKLLIKTTQWWPVLVVLSIGFLLWIDISVPINDIWRIHPTANAYKNADYPVEAATFLVEHSDEYQGARTFHSYGWGGYLLYRVPWFETFIDGRMPSWEQDGTKYIDEYLRVDRAGVEWQAIFKKYDIDTVVLKPDHKLIGTLQSETDFTERFRDEQAVIFSKR